MVDDPFDRKQTQGLDPGIVAHLRTQHILNVSRVDTPSFKPISQWGRPRAKKESNTVADFFALFASPPAPEPAPTPKPYDPPPAPLTLAAPLTSLEPDLVPDPFPLFQRPAGLKTLDDVRDYNSARYALERAKLDRAQEDIVVLQAYIDGKPYVDPRNRAPELISAMKKRLYGSTTSVIVPKYKP